MMNTSMHAQAPEPGIRIPCLHAASAAGLRMAFVFGLVGLLSSRLLAQTTNETADLLARVAQNMGHVQSVLARFEQERHLSLFQEPLHSEGYLCFEKPGRLRWQIVQPYQSILVSDGKGVAQFERVNERWKKLELGLADVLQNVTAQIGAVMEGRYATRQQDYSVNGTNTADGPVVTLTPRHPAMRKMMQGIEIHLAPDLRGTRRVVLREAGGDFTDIRFSEQVTEPPLPPGTFHRRNPADLEQILRAVQQPKPMPSGKPGLQ
jgi:outer membrane lipoprotein-sorting protein